MKQLIVFLVLAISLPAFGQKSDDAINTQDVLIEKLQPVKHVPPKPFSTTSTSLPLKISYQGMLTTASGTPVADGSYDLTIDLYDSLTNGNSQWSEVHSGVPVQHGTFNIALGAVTPLNLQFNKPFFVQVKITSGPAGPSYPVLFSPRSELTSSPYSLAPWATNGTDIYYKNGNLGIGSSAPESSGIGTLKIDIADEDGTNSDIALRVAGGSGSAAFLHFAKSRGTLGSLALTGPNDPIGFIQFDGYSGTAYQATALISSYIRGTPSLTSMPGRLIFWTTPDGSTSLSPRMDIDPNGDVGIGTLNPQQNLSVNAAMNLDQANLNDGTVNPGLTFGTGSGEGMASKRTATGNQYGLDFYTFFKPRVSITQTGNVGVGTTAPGHKFESIDSSVGVDNPAVYGRHAVTDFYGIGVAGVGLYEGVNGAVTASGTNTYFGVYGYGSTSAAGIAYGVFGTAFTSGGTSYGGYFSGNLAYTGSLINASDAKLKENVQSVSGALEKIMQLNPRSYNFKSADFKSMSLPSGTHYGFVAQELEKVFPELVVDAVQPPEQGNKSAEPLHYKGVKYVELIPVLLEAIQEQQKTIEGQQRAIEELKSKIGRLEIK